MSSNIELKARVHDWQACEAVARRWATAGPEVQQQVDTYFIAQQGRLKLREINGLCGELIWYLRPDHEASRESRYERIPVGDYQVLKSCLAQALGVRAVVTKRRTIYWWNNVRIHLDQVEGRGEFLEFEAVLGDTVTAAEGYDQVAKLRREFGIVASDLIVGSYGDFPVDSAESAV